MRVRVVGACASRTPGIQLAFISLYSSQTPVRPGRKLLLLKGAASLFRTVLALPVAWPRCRGPPSWLEWPSNEIVKAGRTEREEAPVVQGNVAAAKLAVVHPRPVQLIYVAVGESLWTPRASVMHCVALRMRPKCQSADYKDHRSFLVSSD